MGVADCGSVHLKGEVGNRAVVVVALVVQLWPAVDVVLSVRPQRERDVVEAPAQPTGDDANVVRSVH